MTTRPFILKLQLIILKHAKSKIKHVTLRNIIQTAKHTLRSHGNDKKG